MQSVSDKYYIWYNRVTMVFGSLLVLAVGASFLVSQLAFLHTKWGFIPIVAVIGGLQLLYGQFFFKRSSSPWIGGMTAALILATGVYALMHNSGQLHSWFVAVWLVQVFAGGMYGMYSLIGCGFMTTIYYVLTATGAPDRKLIDPIAIGVVLGTYFVGLISYFVWKRLYGSQESQRITQLTGQLKSKQQQTEILIQSISDGMIVTDTEGKISLLNPAAAKMTEWSVDEALGIDVELVAKFAQEDGKDLPAGDDPFKKVLKSGAQASSILQLLGRSKKTPHVVSIVVSPVITNTKSQELTGTVAVIRDVSAARQEEHRRADFISTASHEMRTPVAAIEGYLQLALNEKVSRIDAKARDYLNKALESTHRLGTLFQDLLTSAKAEDGRLVNHPRVIEMGEYLERITEGLRFAAEKKGMLMDFVVGAGGEKTGSAAGTRVVKPLYYAHIDPDRMQEVITNLFDNAVKYSEKGKVTVGLTGNNDVIQFFVRDTGHGIPPEDVPHLFQKFYRVDNSTTRTIGGTGLGLFISRKIVEMYNGRIWVESELGKGSTFYINVPRLSSQKAAELQTQESQELV
jgi:PAS domain S-box-containing protein